MNEDVIRFMDLFDASPELQCQYAEAEALYPGSLEIRDTLVEEVLIPFAEERGFHFFLSDLRKYETRKYLHSHRDVEQDPDMPDDDSHYWLLEHGWTNDESVFSQSGQRESDYDI